MATKTDLALLLTKGALSNLWSSTQKQIIMPSALNPNTPGIQQGQIYVGLDNINKRAMLFVDDVDDERYVFTADVAWSDIRNVPTDLVRQSALNTHITSAQNTYLPMDGSKQMTGPLKLNNTKLSFLFNTTETAYINYNNITQSLDFTFT